MASYESTCALFASGRAQCWGDNSLGQLGIGLLSRAEPRPVAVRDGWGRVLSGQRSFGLGLSHGCAAFDDGSARCWGTGWWGQIGDGVLGPNHVVAVPSTVIDDEGRALHGVAQARGGGSFSCALLEDTTARCWGDNGAGQLGTGSNGAMQPFASAPVFDAFGGGALRGVSQLALGSNFGCALLADSTVRCWGENAEGELGRGAEGPPDPVPRPVVDAGGEMVRGASQIAAGPYHACAVVEGGGVSCWGSNAFGQLGTGSEALFTPAAVAVVDEGGVALRGARQIALNDPSCAALDDTSLRCWGDNAFGQVGDGTSGGPVRRAVAVRDASGGVLGGVLEVAPGSTHVCARRQDDSVLCWGGNNAGQLGGGTTAGLSPAPAP
ncbi:MAG TPA: hypothetical protein VFS00_33895, partial [Polyangiaceae bacterium]|nr:hypothetical protein [Polyangiaceae bacterium]